MKKILILISVALFCFQASAREELVINSDTTFAPSHANRLSFNLGVNPSVSKAQDVTNLIFSYGRLLEDHAFWLDGSVAITKGAFRKLSANNPSATQTIDPNLDDQKNTLTSIGIGVSRETRYAQTLLPIDNVYELMAADLTYNSYKEDFSAKTFTGPGLLAKFSLFKKFNDYFSAGLHFNYNLAVVKRSQDFADETSSARSLTLGFLTVGLDLSFYL